MGEVGRQQLLGGGLRASRRRCPVPLCLLSGDGWPCPQEAPGAPAGGGAGPPTQAGSQATHVRLGRPPVQVARLQDTGLVSQGVTLALPPPPGTSHCPAHQHRRSETPARQGGPRPSASTAARVCITAFPPSLLDRYKAPGDPPGGGAVGTQVGSPGKEIGMGVGSHEPAFGFHYLAWSLLCRRGAGRGWRPGTHVPMRRCLVSQDRASQRPQ